METDVLIREREIANYDPNVFTTKRRETPKIDDMVIKAYEETSYIHCGMQDEQYDYNSIG